MNISLLVKLSILKYVIFVFPFVHFSLTTFLLECSFYLFVTAFYILEVLTLCHTRCNCYPVYRATKTFH